MVHYFVAILLTVSIFFTSCLQSQTFLEDLRINDQFTYEKVQHSLSQLNICTSELLSYERLNPMSNRSYVYLLELKDRRKIVLRILNSRSPLFYRESEIEIASLAAKEKISPEIIFTDILGRDFYINQFVDSKPLLQRDFRDPSLLGQAAELISRVHTNLGTVPHTKSELNLVFDLVDRIYGHALPVPSVFDEALFVARLMINIFFTNPRDLVPSHGDLHSRNFLFNDKKRLVLIDWECAGMCNRFIDLSLFSVAMLLNKELEIFFLKRYFKEDYSATNVLKFNLFKFLFSFFESVYFFAYPFLEKDPPYTQKIISEPVYNHEFLQDYWQTCFIPSSFLEIRYIHEHPDFICLSDKCLSQKTAVLYLKYFYQFIKHSEFAYYFKNFLTNKLINTSLFFEKILLKYFNCREVALTLGALRYNLILEK